VNAEALALEIPGLEKLDRIDGLEARVAELEKQLEKTGKVAATVLSGLLPGGMMHDRIAETRAAVKALIEDPGSPHHAAATAALRLSWGNMGVEG